VLKQLEPLLDTAALTVTGRTVGQNLAGVTIAHEEVIRPPEAARGGPLALVRVDVPARTVDLDVPEAELQRRRGALRAPAPSPERGWLSIYQRLVRPLPEGATLREPAQPGNSERQPGFQQG
jgi:dihydroxyacid dehydratase/phosphogluconate dehydratase